MTPRPDPDYDTSLPRVAWGDDPEKSERRRLVAIRVFWSSLLILVLVMLGLQTMTIIEIRTTQMYGCITPGGECYELNKTDRADAVETVKDVVIAAAACSSNLDPQTPVIERESKIRVCVLQRLAADDTHGQLQP